MYRFLFFAFSLLLLFSCNSRKEHTEAPLNQDEENQVYQMATAYFQALPDAAWTNYSPVDLHRIRLGKKLFYDKRLSKNQTLNCASCHKMEQFGQDNLRVSPGDGGEFGLRNTPTVLNAFLQYAQFWDVRVRTVEDQAAMPIFGQREMGMTDTLELLNRIASDSIYTRLFGEAFPGEDTIIGIETLKRALGSFERTLLTPSRFDRYLKGDRQALSPDEKRGMRSFIENGCIPCHSGVLLGGNMAQKFALFGYYWDYTGSTNLDKGRYQETLDPSDKFVFKVPGLRNVAETGPYFHDGSVESLEESIRIMSLAELNLAMEEEDIRLVTRFLQSLTGEVPDYSFEDRSFPFDQDR